MQAIATQKFLRMSPKKIRPVADMVRNLTPSEAVERLPYVDKRAAEPLLKVIKTAIANAKEKGMSEADLVFKEIQIGDGPRLKRYRFRAHGRVKPYVKKMSHIRVVVTGKPQKTSAKKQKTNDKKSEKTK